MHKRGGPTGDQPPDQQDNGSAGRRNRRQADQNPSQTEALATTEFNNVFRLMTSNTYRTTNTTTAMLNTSRLTNSVVRTAAGDGPAFAEAGTGAWSTWSVSPHRGIPA